MHNSKVTFNEDTSMKIDILVDNLANPGLTPEWGLAAWISYGGKSILLDGGTSGVFVDNAGKMGIDVSQADMAILSHAHYDHANGLPAFFEKNSAAKLYMRKGSAENCYDCSGEEPRYIGIRKGFLEEYADRIVYVEGDYKLADGITLIPHKTQGLEQLGKRIGMCVEIGGVMCPECFAHEQSLVFETPKGLVILNSCSHGGADNIITEAAQTFPGKRIYALVGGLHLFKAPEEEIKALADRVQGTGIEKIYTGHCTGARAVELLRQELGDMVQPIYTGMEITL